MFKNIIVSREGMGLREKTNVAVAALKRAYNSDVKTYLGTNGADVVLLKGDDDKTYMIQVRDHDAIVTLLG